MIVLTWFIWFIIYSIIGWILETAFCSAAKGRFVNRGFLNGPLCPVYGFGALICVLLLYGRADNAFVLLFAGMLLNTVTEYLTAVMLEKLFKAKWWDYSERRFNIKGRVCLKNALMFGALSVVLIKYIHPFVSKVTGVLTDNALIIISLIIFAAILMDTFFTIKHLVHLNSRLEEFQKEFNSFLARYKKRTDELRTVLIESFEQSELYNEHIKQRFEAIRHQSRRLLKAYPKLKPIKNSDAWHRFKHKFNEIQAKENKDGGKQL